MGRSIVRQPKAFLFDEPLSNLDALLRAEMRVEIKRLHQKLGNTIIYVTHDQVEAMTLADRIVVLQAGNLIQYDTPDAIYNRPAAKFVAGFTGSPPMNFLPCRVGRRRAHAAPAGRRRPRGARRRACRNARGTRDASSYSVCGPSTLSAGDAGVTGQVMLVEPLGSDTLGLIKLGIGEDAGEMTGRFPPEAELRVGQPLRVALAMSRFHLFDPDTGSRGARRRLVTKEETMKFWRIASTAVIAAALAAPAWSQTTLRIFTGGQQRPDVMRKIADEYQKKNPNVKIDVEVGGATSEAQQQYLSTVLSSKDSALDVILIDVIRPAQWAAQGWAEPLDSYLGADKAKILPTYLKAYADANQVGGKLMALPYFADAQFLYYRKDLLEKYKRPVPEELGRDDGDGEGSFSTERRTRSCRASRPPARRSKAPCARTSSRCGAWAATSPRTASSISTRRRRGSRSSCTVA